MRNRDTLPGEASISWAQIPDIDQRAGGELTGRRLQQEYEGLDSGELAWIMGRRFVNQTFDGEDGHSRLGASAHGLGMGAGPDRMQRLAYTSWVEGFFRAKFGKIALDLTKLQVSSAKVMDLSSLCKDYAPFVTGATVLRSVDVPFVMETVVGRRIIPSDDAGQRLIPRYSGGQPGGDAQSVPVQGEAGLASGLFVMERGPFLRGKIINADAVDVISPTCLAANSNVHIKHTLPRNLGDELAFEALYAELRSAGMFDWTPDGMVLSKLGSPAGDPMGSAELDARSGQLFNIAVQGPAVAKTWTGDSKMACMPMDKVFVVMVADVHGSFGNGTTKHDEYEKTFQAAKMYGNWANPSGNNVKKFSPENRQAYISSKGDAEDLGDGKDVFLTTDEKKGYAELVEKRFTTFAAAAAPGADKEAGAASVTNRAGLDAHFKCGNGTVEWGKKADQLRRGAIELKTCTMSNFRMMRVTSSFLTSYSHVEYDNDDYAAIKKGTRCGLRAGTKARAIDEPVDEFCSEFIIGGWCIGTVLDSAASRSTVGHQVRTAPASMAINVNVNVEWWSGDKLYKHYMDVDGLVHQRGQSPTPAGEKARNRKTEQGLADRPEMASWWPQAT